VNFKMKYQIKRLYLTAPSMRRSGQRINKIKFLVAHDTGNEGSTARANVMYYSKTENQQSASAHIFVDHAEIIECIPSMDKPEKAWHVLYNVTADDDRFGDDANDCAIGVELCYGGAVNTKEAYAKYIWTLAYLCHVYELDPRLHIVGHHELDPKRKTDPVNALKTINRTMDDLLEDVAFELELCRYGDDPQMQEIIKRIETLEKANAQYCPEWAKPAQEAAMKKGLIQQVDMASRDFWRLLAIMHRAKVI
jgi:N-acetylmuramoyl-L-alanine amidase